MQFICLVDRTILKPIYWNKTRMYDSSSGLSKRVPNDQGYYEIEMAGNGTSAVYKTKDVSIVKSIDSNAARCCGLEFDAEDPTLITKFASAKATTRGGSAASWYNVTSINKEELTFTAKKFASGSDQGKEVTCTMSKKCLVYDVTNIDGSVFGGATELKVGDQIHGLTNAKGQVVYVWIVGGRTVDSDIYWNTSRQYDSTKQETKRTPNAEGKYVFKLGVGSKGAVEEFWTKSKEIATLVDSYAVRCFGLKLNGKEIIKAYKSTAVTGGTSFASWYDIDTLKGNYIHCTKTDGKQAEGELADDVLVIDTSNNCVKSKLSVGDTIHGLTNPFGKVKVAFIITKAPQLVKNGYCSHCNKTVPWYALASGMTPKTNFHYILPSNIYGCSQISFGSVPTEANLRKFILGTHSTVDCVLDLNGYTLSGAKRAVAVGMGSKLTIMDSRGGGVITSETKTPADSGYGVWLCYNSVCNLTGGTVDMTGVVNNANGTAVGVSAGAVLNMYSGATIKNGTSTYNKYINSSGKEAFGGGYGGNVYLASNTTQTYKNSSNASDPNICTTV